MSDMSREARLALLEQVLERAAENVGDITTPTLERLYEVCPESKDAFERLALGDRPHLEGRMVENCLYFMMEWYGRPGEVTGIIEDTVPHHRHTLEIPPEWYWAMLDAALSVVSETIPDDATDERMVWDDMHTALRAEIAEAGTW